MDRKIDLSLFREKFVGEARDRLSRMNGYLVYLEKNPGDTKLEGDLLREAHTLKGAARMMGLAKVSDLAHRFEEAVASRTEKHAPFHQDLVDALFLTLDTLSRLVEALAQTQREAIDIQDVLDRLRLAQAPAGDPVAPGPRPGPPSPPVSPPPEIGPLAGPAPEAGRGIRVEPERLEHLANLLTGAVGRHLRQVELRSRIGEAGRSYRRVAAELVACVENAIAAGIVSPEFAAGAAPIVEAGRKAFREAGTHLADLRRREEEEISALSQTLEDLRSDVLAIRMIPLLPLFESFRRAVRDLSRQLGKDVDLVVRGGKTEIDRKVAETLGDPLIHLIRNAVDHGIEPPEVRAEMKKPPKGRLTITATPKKGRVVIEVEDDGRGIDLQEIRETAIRRGLTTEKAAYRLDDRELLSFIFRPGFTTAKTMTEISGRGIGMDIVRETAEKFNGTVEIFTNPGHGTRVVLELPFTMAVSRVLLFLVGGQYFGIPVMHAEGVLRFTDRDVSLVEGRRSLCLDGSPVPVVWLCHLFETGPHRPPPDGHLAVLVRHSHRKIALVVDRIEGESEVVVKDLGPYLGKVPLFMGSTVLGTADVALLLDVYDLVSAVRLRPDTFARAEARDAAVSGDVLVVDGSLLSREMQERVFASEGFRVETAADGRTALDLLSRKRFDLVVAATRTPGIDGADLVSHIRGKDRLKDLRVILVTSRGSPADRERALASGADGCIDREEFCMERLAPLLGRPQAGADRDA